MININTYHHIKLNKWLLLVTLLFSIFNLSGNVNDYQSQLRQKTQTELLLSSKQKSGNQLISYKKALELSSFHNLIKYPNISWINTFHFDNITTLEKLKTNLKHCYAHNNAIFFFHSKTFPQSSDEDVVVPFLG
jgi:hypothetical protein